MKVYCKLNGVFHMYDGEKFFTVKTRPKGSNELDKNFFDEDKELNECLENYHKTLLIWFDEINEGLNLKLKRSWYRSEVQLLYLLFKIFRTDKDIEYDPVSFEESKWIEGCYRSGITYAKFGEYKNVNAYDFKKYYANLLGGDTTKKQFPMKAGIPTELKELPDKLTYGIYRVRITSKKENIQSIFSFSSENHYTHEDIQYALFLKKWGYIDTVELIQDGEDNALLYYDLINSKDIFGRYVNILNKLALDYPKNKSIKMLLSSVWGRIWTKNTIIKMTETKWLSLNEEEKNKHYCVKVEFEFDWKKKESYTVLSLVKAESLYKYNIRVQPFITSFARKKMGNRIVKHFDDIVRVQTDGVIFKNTPETCNLDKGFFVIDKNYNKKDIKLQDKKHVYFI